MSDHNGWKMTSSRASRIKVWPDISRGLGDQIPDGDETETDTTMKRWYGMRLGSVSYVRTSETQRHTYVHFRFRSISAVFFIIEI
jgi:hypothetical protein